MKSLELFSGETFNVTPDSDFDCSGGRPFRKDAVKHIQDLCLDFDLVDIWRIRNPDSKRFTWRQRNPFIQRRLDYWLISDVCQDDIEKSDGFYCNRSHHGNVATPLRFLFIFVFLCIRTFFFKKSLKGVCTCHNCLNYGKVWTNSMRAFSKYFETKF